MSPHLPTRHLRLTANLTFASYLILASALSSLPLASRLPVACLNGILFTVFCTLTATLVHRSLDEFQRTLLNRAFVASAFLVMAFAAVWGHMELPEGVHMPHLPALLGPVLLILLTTLTKVLIFRRHAPRPEPAL